MQLLREQQSADIHEAPSASATAVTWAAGTEWRARHVDLLLWNQMWDLNVNGQQPRVRLTGDATQAVIPQCSDFLGRSAGRATDTSGLLPGNTGRESLHGPGLTNGGTVVRVRAAERATSRSGHELRDQPGYGCPVRGWADLSW